MKQRISYMLGAFGHDMYYATLSGFFILFVTSKLFEGLPAAEASRMIAFISSLVVIIRLIEIGFDPVIGGIIDNTNTRFGKFKPWIAIGGVISSVALALIFSDFFGIAHTNTILYTILFIIVFIILDAFYSFKDIAFWSMLPALTTDNREREKLATVARLGSSFGGSSVGMFIVPIIAFFTLMVTGHSGQGASGWFWFGMIVAIISGGTALITAWGTEEKQSELRQIGQKTTTIEIFKSIAKNDQLLWISLTYILYAIANVATQSTLMLYFKYVLDALDSYSLVGLIGMIAGFIAVPLFPILVKKLTRRLVFTIGILFMIVGYGIFLTAGTNLTAVLVGIAIFLFPQQLVFLSVLMTITDAVEYGQWKNGVRNEAVTLAMRPLLDKLAGALGNGFVGFIAVSVGMTGSATAASITSSNVSAFKMYVFILPAIVMALALVIFLSRINLTEKRHQEIVKELKARVVTESRSLSNLTTKFEEKFGGSENVNYFFSPGSINLLGENTNYKDGHVLSIATTVGTMGVARLRTDDKIRLYSMNFEEQGLIEFRLSELKDSISGTWANDVKAMILNFNQSGYEMTHGFDLLVKGDIPITSGLSSSASLEILVATVLNDLYALNLDRLAIVKLGQQAENSHTGVQSRVIAQFAITFGRNGKGILLDGNTLDYKLLPIELGEYDLVVMNTNVAHEVGNFKYNERVSETQSALKALQSELSIQTLNQLTPVEFDAHKTVIGDEMLIKRARYVVYENNRVKEAQDALAAGDLTTFGQLLNDSQASLKEDFEVTTQELDTLVTLAQSQEGVLGVRMTSIGFSGSALAFVKHENVPAFEEKVGNVYESETGNKVAFYTTQIGNGAEKIVQ
ncbi:galactokinase [Lactococcus lactis]|uniref:galactokinase n=1 Tax=Lactococcus lactis TaxID=1358 RepID=UPI003565B92D